MNQLLLLITLLILSACGGSPSDQARKLQETKESWDATVRLTTDLWHRGAVPSEYASQTLEAAQRELEKIRQKAEKLTQ